MNFLIFPLIFTMVSGETMLNSFYSSNKYKFLCDDITTISSDSWGKKDLTWCLFN